MVSKYLSPQNNAYFVSLLKAGEIMMGYKNLKVETAI